MWAIAIDRFRRSDVLATGQRWRYRATPGGERSRLVIGAILSFAEGRRIICVSVIDAGLSLDEAGPAIPSIPFIPLAEAAFMASVTDLDGDGEVAEGFAVDFAAWQADPKGLTVFTVPFEGSLDRLIASQMQAIVTGRVHETG